jgi:ubiquinone/menaquinone biosynthesis C-methylase UbiE
LGTDFKDYFSEASDRYEQYRPTYPQALFDYLFTLTQNNDRAWDCATGNGQSALSLSEHYTEVLATDASRSQIDSAIKKTNIKYFVESAEKTLIDSNSIDLVTVAQALHWFDHEKFSSEVMRVLKTQGVLAVWTYGLLKINPALDSMINQLCNDILALYWPPERKMVDNAYRDIHFPLKQNSPHLIQMSTHWTLGQLVGYLHTWSAVKRYYKETGAHPVDALVDDLSTLWGDPDKTLLIQWPLTVKTWVKD